MATNSKIEWTEATWNPVTGCSFASEGCRNCYAVGMTHRLEAMGQEKYKGLTVLNGRGDRQFNGMVKTHDGALDIPLKRKKPTRYFVNSMADLFHSNVPFDFIDKVFAVMALTSQHTYQVLTKRPERMAEYMTRRKSLQIGTRKSPVAWDKTSCDEIYAAAMKQSGKTLYEINPEGLIWPLPNVWLGTTVENQKAADERIPELMKCPAAVRWLSCEPLLGAVDLNHPIPWGDHGKVYPLGLGSGRSRIHWVVAGGESGPNARPCDIQNIRSLIEQGHQSGVPVFVKQLGAAVEADYGEVDVCSTMAGWKHLYWADKKHQVCRPTDKKGGDWSEWPEDLRVRQFPEVSA